MRATYYITRIDGSKFEFDIPVGSRKQARKMVSLIQEEWGKEGWFIKQDGEFDLTMVKGLNDPAYHLVID